jgi:hypothetical protein
MPVFIEPTPLLAHALGELRQGPANTLWRALDQANLRIARLLEQVNHLRLLTAYTRELALAERLVCHLWGLPATMLHSRLRHNRLVLARTQLAALAREQFCCTQLELATLLGRDRSTVSHSLRVHANLLRTDSLYRSHYLTLKARYAHAIQKLHPNHPQPSSAQQPAGY